MNSSFLDKIRYKKERVGIVEKNGKAYVKYLKARRFKVHSNIKFAIVIGIVLLVFELGIKLLISELASRPPAEETAAGIGG